MGVSKLMLACFGVIAFHSCLPFAVSSAEAAGDKSKQEQSQSLEIREEQIGNKCFQVSKILIHVKPEQVWRILTDYENAPSVFPCLKKCRLVKNAGASKVVEHEIKPSGVPGTFNYLIEVKEVVNRLYEWHRISGDFREVDGFWKLDPVNEGNSTLVTYASFVNGGILLPAPLIKRQVRLDIPGVMSALKTHAETARTIAGTGRIKGN